MRIINDYIKDNLPDKCGKFINNYIKLIEKFNKKINLVSYKNIDDLFFAHMLDGYLGAKYLKEIINPSLPLYDLGSGNGIPCFFLAYNCPSLEVISIEKDKRKSEAMKMIAFSLGLHNVKFISTLLEDFNLQKINQATSRGFMPLGKFLKVFPEFNTLSIKYFPFKSVNWLNELGVDQKTSFKVESEYILPDTYGSRVILSLN